MRAYKERALYWRHAARTLAENALKVDGGLRTYRLSGALNIIRLHGPSHVRSEAKALIKRLERL